MPIVRLFAACLLSFVMVLPAAAERLQALAADLPPLSIEAEQAGFCHDLMVLVAERAGYEVEVEYLPWQRAQRLVQDGDRALTFTLTRTPARESLYKWITPIIDYQNVFVTTTAQVDDVSEAAAFGAVVVRKGTPHIRYLKSHGIDPIATSGIDQILRMIDGGRPVVWYTTDLAARWAWQRALMASSPVLGAPVDGGTFYLAAGPNFPDDIAADLHDTMEALRADGTIDALKAKYFGPAS